MTLPAPRIDRPAHSAAAGAAFGGALMFVALFGALAINDAPRTLRPETDPPSKPQASARLETAPPALEALRTAGAGDPDGAAFQLIYEVTG